MGPLACVVLVIYGLDLLSETLIPPDGPLFFRHIAFEFPSQMDDRRDAHRQLRYIRHSCCTADMALAHDTASERMPWGGLGGT